MIKRNANVNVKSQKAVRRLLVVAAIALVGGGVACWGAAIGFSALRSIWLEQFRVQDSAIDVIVTTPGVNVIPEIITFHFGLTNGANLATIPYQEKSRELIARNPNIRSISIERRLPRRVIIDVKEREPAVRIVAAKGTESAGLVADYDGVVFRTFKAPSQLPVMRESAETRHTPGQRLEGHAYAALQLVHVLADAAEGKSGAPRARRPARPRDQHVNEGLPARDAGRLLHGGDRLGPHGRGFGNRPEEPPPPAPAPLAGHCDAPHPALHPLDRDGIRKRRPRVRRRPRAPRRKMRKDIHEFRRTDRRT